MVGHFTKNCKTAMQNVVAMNRGESWHHRVLEKGKGWWVYGRNGWWTPATKKGTIIAGWS
jgi:hypothetical protein